MVEDKIILSYNGHFKFETIQFLIYKAKKEMDALGTEIAVKKKVVNIMVECLENIHKHSDIFESDDTLDLKYASRFSFEIKGDDYIITAGNVIFNSNIDKLKYRIDQVNQLDRFGLKKLYEQVITKTDISQKGGAGLGIIDIALKSGNPVEYSFEKINNKFSFYTIYIKVTKKKNNN